MNPLFRFHKRESINLLDVESFRLLSRFLTLLLCVHQNVYGLNLTIKVETPSM